MTEKQHADVVVLGGGPAGLSAASWCAELGLDVTLLERERDIGGQLHRIFAPIENYLGRSARDGAEMLSYFRASVERSSFRRMFGTHADSVDTELREVRLADGKVVGYRALIIATGVRRRMLNVEGEAQFRGCGIIESGVRERAETAGRKVVIVGGGDAALENASILADIAQSVTVVHRRNDFTARAEFLASIGEKSNVEFKLNSVVRRIEGDSSVTGVEIENLATRTTTRLAADIVLIRIGVEPNSDLVRGVVDLDGEGYVIIDSTGQTSVPGVFAAGDIANPASPTLSTAAGTGATAAKSAYLFIDNK
jgi:thioredoxin reductase (NADPH)